MASPPLETLGRYRLVRVLGRGAMGVVYEALDERLGRTVAIKTVLRSHLDNESTAQDYAARFVREAQAAARLSHPNIVTVYDFGEHDDLSYIVMEFVSGRELADLFRSGHRFTLSRRCRSWPSCWTRWPTPMVRAWCTATSSRPMCWWIRRAV
jgi:serine/threonine protein kinase